MLFCLSQVRQFSSRDSSALRKAALVKSSFMDIDNEGLGLTEIIQKKKNSKSGRIEITDDITDIWVDARKPRIVPVHSLSKDGKVEERHLKITLKGKLALL